MVRELSNGSPLIYRPSHFYCFTNISYLCPPFLHHIILVLFSLVDVVMILIFICVCGCAAALDPDWVYHHFEAEVGIRTGCGLGRSRRWMRQGGTLKNKFALKCKGCNDQGNVKGDNGVDDLNFAKIMVLRKRREWYIGETGYTTYILND